MSLMESCVTLATLILLEIILGIDNLVFLTILSEKLPGDSRRKARQWGLTFAWLGRIILLAFSVVLVKLNDPVIVFQNQSFSIRNLFLLIGGGFLIAKAIQEIHLEILPHNSKKQSLFKSYQSFWRVVVQIGLMDLIFSIDSVMTAVGLTSEFTIMAIAITISIIGMLYLSSEITKLIRLYPTLKMLALCFLLLIGTFLVADGFSFHIPREYLYIVLVFSLGIETLNIVRTNKKIKR